MSNPVVSIIIPTYNRCELLKYTLDSILAQTASSRLFEIIVSDDGSSDDTKLLVDSYRSTGYIVKYCFQEDLGYRVASARNNGINAASGEILLFIDSGIILSPHCVEAHINSHFSSKKNEAVIGYIYFVEKGYGDILEGKSIMDLSFVEIEGIFCEKDAYLDYREKVYKTCNDVIDELPAPWALCWTGNLSVKKELVKKVGMFDSEYDLNWGIEDVDLGYKLKKIGCRFLLNRKASSIHYPHNNDTVEKFRQEETNKKYFHKKFNCRESEALLEAPAAVELNLRLQSLI